MALRGMVSHLYIFIVLLGSIATLVHGDESLLQILLKHPINVVSDEFVSFAMDPMDALFLSDQTL